MATDVQNWTKAYNKKNPKATDAMRKAALAKWQKAKKGGGAGAGTGTNPGNSLPVGWGMTRGPDVLGSWANKPNLDPTEYEIEQGQDKKYYARKRTELTGLEGYQKDAIRKWDADTANRSNLMSGVETQAVNAASTIGNAGAARMSDLATLIQSAPQSQALGGVATGSGATQQMQSSDQQAPAQSAGANARLAAVQMATAAEQQAKAAPTLAGYSMASLTNQARSNDAATRQKLLSAFRTSNAEAQAAKDTAIAKTYSDQARLLAASIQSGARITAEQISQMGENYRNTQDNEVSLANNAADNATSGANNAANNAATAGADRTKATRAFVATIPTLLMGKQSESTDASGKTTRTVTQAGVSPMAVLQQGLAQGIPAGPILAALMGQNTPALNKLWKPNARKTNRPKAIEVGRLLLSKGVSPRNVQRVVLRYMGIDLGPNGTGKGPGGVDVIP